MLPIRLSEESVDELFQRASKPGYQLTVNLNDCTVTDAAGLSLPFEVEEARRFKLLRGLDDIALTLEHEAKISAYEAARGMQPV